MATINFWNCNCNCNTRSIYSQMQPNHIKNLQQHQHKNGLLLFFKPPTKPSIQFQSTTLPLALKMQSSSTPVPPTILKATSDKLVILLVGGLLFMASFGCKPLLAQPTNQKTTISQHMVENNDTQNEDSNDELYMKLLEKNPKDIDTLKVVLSRKMVKGKTNEAIEYVERLIKLQPQEVEWRLLQALLYEMMGNLSQAKMLFRDILEERPLLLRALHGLAMVMHKNLEGPAVFEMLNKALELAQREKRVTEERNIRILIAQTHVVKGELEEGLKKFHDLVDENPRDFRPYLCKGIIYSLLDRKKEAEEHFETYQSLVPQEFPQRGFLDDVVLAAKTEPREKLDKELKADFSYKMKTSS